MPIRYKDIYESLLPDGSAWSPARGEGMDHILEGQGKNAEARYNDFKKLAYLKDPYLTPMLSDLERENGLIPNTALSETVRRMQLASIVYQPDNNGSAGHMKQQLDIAGFTNLQVHQNNPITDPNTFLNGTFEMYCGDADAQCGEAGAQCGGTVGELVVNGDLYDFSVDFVCGCDEPDMLCGEAEAQCGQFTGTSKDIIKFTTVPDQAEYWPFVFFIGGDIVVDDDEILSIDYVDVPFGERDHLRRLILKYKPLATWCALLVNFV